MKITDTDKKILEIAESSLLPEHIVMFMRGDDVVHIINLDNVLKQKKPVQLSPDGPRYGA